VQEASIWTNWIQLGFAGFSVILVVVIVWLIGRLLKVLAESNKVIAGSTTAIALLSTSATESKQLLVEVKDGLLSRPCQLPDDLKEEVLQILKRRREAKA
jgi:hypothetical protein